MEGKTIGQTGCIAGQFGDYEQSMSSNYYAGCNVYAGTAARSVNCAVGGQERTGVTPLFTITADEGISISDTPTKTYSGIDYYASGTEVTLSHNDRTGYTFSGYSTSAGTLSGSTLTMPASDVTVSATWTPSDNIALTANLADGNYWTTFYCGDASYKIDEGENATAYTAEVNGDDIILHSLNRDIPKNTAVIIKGEDGSISMTKVADPDLIVPTNDLHGVDVQTTTASITSTLGDGTFYVLGNTNSHFGFHKYTGTAMPARKAFLLISGDASRDFFGMEEETTSLSEEFRVESGEFATAEGYYDLNGRKVINPTKGIYIVNGKKVIKR